MLFTLFVQSSKDHLSEAISYWNDKFNAIYDILTTNPQDFQGGTAWSTVTNILNALESIGATLLILFFFYGLFKMSLDVRDYTRNPKLALFAFARVGIAEFFVTHTTEILVRVITIVQGIVSKVPRTMLASVEFVPDEIDNALENADWWSKLGAWASTLVGKWIIMALVIIVIVIVYERFFKIFLLTAIAPIPIAGFSSDTTTSFGMNFLKSYTCELLRGVVMLVACNLFSTFIKSDEITRMIVSSTSSGWTVTGYVMDLIMQLLLLVITIKGSDRLVKEIFGLGGA